MFNAPTAAKRVCYSNASSIIIEFLVILESHSKVIFLCSHQEEWVKRVKSLLEKYRSERMVSIMLMFVMPLYVCVLMYTVYISHTYNCIVPHVPEIRYATVDVFVNKGIRVNGDIGTVLGTQLCSPSSKKVSDDRGT